MWAGLVAKLGVIWYSRARVKLQIEVLRGLGLRRHCLVLRRSFGNHIVLRMTRALTCWRLLDDRHVQPSPRDDAAA